MGKKAGPWRLGRFKYLQALVTEYQDTHKQGRPSKIFLDSKVSVNSSEFPCLQISSCRCWLTWPNFAYDPVNNKYFRELNILDLFLGE